MRARGFAEGCALRSYRSEVLLYRLTKMHQKVLHPLMVAYDGTR